MSSTSVLLVEDDPGDARLVRELLADAESSFDVDHAADLTSATKLANTRPHDVVLLDLTLPDSIGADTVRSAGARFPRTPIVVLTGYDRDEVATMALQHGMQDYLPKSRVTTTGLSRAIAHAIERHTITSQLQVLLAEKEQINQALRGVTRMKDEFVAIASHELRTPVTIVHGFLETLTGRWDGLDPEQRRSLVGVAAEHARRLAELVDDLLVVARDGSTGATRPAVPLDVPQTLARAVSASSLEADHVTIAGSSGHALGDAEYLIRIVRNFLDNARKYARGPYEITYAEVAGTVEVRVRDHGDGVDDAFVPHLFDRFTQADGSLRREQPGTGLGLAIVRDMARSMGGEAWYEHADPGAVFAIRLPAAPQAAANAEGRDVPVAIQADQG